MKHLFLSRRFWYALVVFVAVLNLKAAPLPIVFAIVILANFYNPATWRPLINVRFWILIAMLVLLAPLFTGDLESRFLGIPYSSNELSKMILMSLRGIVVFLLFQILTINLDSQRTRELLLKLRFHHVDSLFTISKETLPTLRSILKARYAQIIKANGRKIHLGQILQFASAVLEDIVCLAENLSTESYTDNSIDPYKLVETLAEKPTSSLIIILGDPGSGKSPWVNHLVSILRARNIEVTGFVSHKVKVKEEVWYHQIENLFSGERKSLNTMEKIPNALRVGKFSFYPEVFQWVLDGTQGDLKANWFILDEVGPLEAAGEGFAPILTLLDLSFGGNVVLTMRTNYEKQLETLLDRYPNLKSRPRIIAHLPSSTGTAIQPLVDSVICDQSE